MRAKWEDLCWRIRGTSVTKGEQARAVKKSVERPKKAIKGPRT